MNIKETSPRSILVHVERFSLTEDLQLEAKEEFKKNGGNELHVIPCLNVREDWVNTLVNWIEYWHKTHAFMSIYMSSKFFLNHCKQLFHCTTPYFMIKNLPSLIFPEFLSSTVKRYNPDAVA